jgi:putative hydrolases of HD superfamily
MYRMSILTMVAPPGIAETVDLAKCMRMCLVHDMAEALVGDITPVDPVSKPEKSRREADTMAYVSDALLGRVYGGIQGQELKALWTEYEEGDSREAAFVKDLDKIELLLQMVEYEKRGAGRLDLAEFCYVATRVALPETRKWSEEIIAERTEFWKSVAAKEAR